MSRQPSRLLPVVALGALLGSSACGPTRAQLQPTHVNPGSTGQIRAKETQNGNTRLDVRVDHLPPPEALDPSLTTYVVWVRPAGGGRYTNLGQIRIGDDRSGRLEATTPYEELFVVVTGEASATTPAPSRYVVLQGQVER